MAETVQHTIRTYSLPTILAYAGAHLTSEQLDAVRAKSPRFFARVAQNDLQGVTPLDEMGEFYLALEEVLGSVEAAYDFVLRSSDEGVGQAALNSFLRLVIKFMPLNVFARKCHDFYRRDVTCGVVTLESFDADARRFVLSMTGMTPYPYGAAAMMGVVRCMMKAMGHEKVRVTEELHPPPAPQINDSYRIVVAWLRAQQVGEQPDARRERQQDHRPEPRQQRTRRRGGRERRLGGAWRLGGRVPRKLARNIRRRVSTGSVRPRVG